MTDNIVINTGPLITLARIEALDLPGGLPFTFVCPEEVREELAQGEAAGYPRVEPGWLNVCSLREPISPVVLSALDRGEAAVIQLALERSIPMVCIDERKGRRAALSVGLRVVGVLGLLGRAKLLGLISALGPFIDRALMTGVRYDPKLVARVLRSVGEQP
ncbi:MAG: DUF3368 domain-containing protein [Pseudomonadota bacterium]|jgi:uncharacterized protein